MFQVGLPVQLWVPTLSAQRVLIRGTVKELLEGGSVVIAEFSKPLTLEPGTEVQLFADFRGKFHQQGATVRAIAPQDEIDPQAGQSAPPETSDAVSALIAFARVGDPVSAESRGSYRVGTSLSEVWATIGKDKSTRHQIVDVSPEGFAVLLPEAPTVGTNLDFRWEFAGTLVEGQGRVQTIKQTGSRAVRVGLLVADSKAPARRALEKVSVVLQREQLKRTARAA